MPSIPRPAPTGPFVSLMNGSDSSVLSIRLVSKAAARLHLRPLSLAALITSLPILLLLLGIMLGGRPIGPTALLVILFAPLNLCLLTFPRATWTELKRGSPTYEALLPSVRHLDLAAWMSRRLRLLPQVLTTLAASFTSLTASIVGAAALHIPLVLWPGYGLSVLLAGALGSNSVWWLWRAPMLARQLAREHHLYLDWLDPYDTPGLQDQRRLMLQSAQRAFVGLMLFGSVVVYSALEATGSLPVQLIAYAGLVISLLTVVFVLIMPRVWLVRAVVRWRTVAIGELRATIRSLTPETVGDPESPPVCKPDLLLLLTHVERRPVFDLSWFVSFVLTLIGAITPYVFLVTQHSQGHGH
jgi:hypothetical protein